MRPTPDMLVFLLGCLMAAALSAAPPPPTHANVSYGTHERQVLDFWQATSKLPTPLVFYIHGGGWIFGDKSTAPAVVQYLAAGISVVSINYRYTSQATAAGILPPVRAPLEDAARALQYVRSRAADWNIEKTRIAATGRSAGACSCLWLAFHDDLADPQSSDRVARESTRLRCAAVVRAQTTLDPQQIQLWTPNSDYGGHAFGFITDPNDKDSLRSQFPQFLSARDKILPWIHEYSPYAHVSAGDPPIYLIYDSVPALGQNANDPTHTANFGIKLQERLREVRIECELVYPGAPGVKHATEQAYLIENLMPGGREQKSTPPEH